MNASASITQLRIVGVEGELSSWEGNPDSLIEDVTQVDGDIVVEGSAAWLPAPFIVEFGMYVGGVYYEAKIELQ